MAREFPQSIESSGLKIESPGVVYPWHILMVEAVLSLTHPKGVGVEREAR